MNESNLLSSPLTLKHKNILRGGENFPQNLKRNFISRKRVTKFLLNIFAAKSSRKVNSEVANPIIPNLFRVIKHI